MRGVDEPYQRWEKRPSFMTKDGRRVYPIYAPAYGGQEDHIRVFDRDVDPADYEVEHSLREHQVASLDWRGRTISNVETGRVEAPGHPAPDEPSWHRQGIARAMLEIARAKDIEPALQHAACTQRSEAGERFVRGTDPGKACKDDCEPDCRYWASQIGMPGEEGSPESVRPLGVWAKIKALVGL